MNPLNLTTASDVIKVNGNTDNGSWHRAVMVARKLYDAGMWDGKKTIRIHSPHNSHNKLFGIQELPATALLLGKDYSFDGKPDNQAMFNTQYVNPFRDNSQQIKAGDIVDYAGRQWTVKSIFSGYPYSNNSRVYIAPLDKPLYYIEVDLTALTLSPMVDNPQPATIPQVGDTVSVTFEYSRHNRLTQKGVVLAVEPSLIGSAIYLTVLFEGDKEPFRVKASDVNSSVRFWR